MNEESILPGDKIAEDKHAKKLLLIETIKKKCAASPHEVLQKINQAINVSGQGDDDGSSSSSSSRIEATVLSGGYTNFSYKVYVDKHPELCVFAKLCFEFALWNPDESAHYDLQRVENEYEIMEKMSRLTPGTVVTPFALWDIHHEGQNMKLLVTEWSKVDEQFCNQFIDGAVDPRIAAQIAATLAKLHSIQEFDPDFNKNVKPCMESLFDHMLAFSVEASKAKSPKDRTEAFCASLGEDVIKKIMDASVANYHQRDCLIHNDSHVFNILVESKPSIQEFDEFGPNGTFVLCDWEMTMAGPIGRDIGHALCFPIGCMIAHSLCGRSEAYKSIEVYVNSLLDAYSSHMTEAGKTPMEMASILRNIAGTLGSFIYLPFYILKVQDFFPVETDADKVYVWDAVGILGLKLMRLAYDADYFPASSGMDEIRDGMMNLLDEEVSYARTLAASRKSVCRQRKSSILRAANRRISDTELLYLGAQSVRRSTLLRQGCQEENLSTCEDKELE